MTTETHADPQCVLGVRVPTIAKPAPLRKPRPIVRPVEAPAVQEPPRATPEAEDTEKAVAAE